MSDLGAIISISMPMTHHVIGWMVSHDFLKVREVAPVGAVVVLHKKSC